MPMRFYPIITGTDWDTCRGCEADIHPGDPVMMRQDGAKFCTCDCADLYGTAPLKNRRVTAAQ